MYRPCNQTCTYNSPTEGCIVHKFTAATCPLTHTGTYYAKTTEDSEYMQGFKSGYMAGYRDGLYSTGKRSDK